MGGTTNFHKFYRITVKGDDLLYPIEYRQLVNNRFFCSGCGDPLYPITGLPDIAIKKMYNRCSIYGISHFKGVPVDVMKLVLLEELSRFIRVEDCLMTGSLLNGDNTKIESHCTFLAKHYLFIRGSTFFKKKCKLCKSLVYNYYQEPHLPKSMIECNIPLFGCLGAGLVVTTEIGLHLKALKMPCLSIWPLKIQDELPQNARVPLFKTFF